jgi:hypothetical protein
MLTSFGVELLDGSLRGNRFTLSVITAVSSGSVASGAVAARHAVQVELRGIRSQQLASAVDPRAQQGCSGTTQGGGTLGEEGAGFFESRVLTCLTYTSRRGSQHRGQTAEHEDTKARNTKLYRP